MDRATVAIYERDADRWLQRRPVRRQERALRLAGHVAPGALRVDLGCGPGRHTPALANGGPAVALDAANAMVRLCLEHAPSALGVQGDVERLPFRSGGLGGAWANAVYQHLPRERLPLALADLHGTLAVNAPIEITVTAGRAGAAEGHDAGSDFPGRWFAPWHAAALADVLHGAGFALEELQHADGEWILARARRARTLADTVGPGMAVLFVGLNPSVYAADAGYGFAGPGNRFWPALAAAGLAAERRSPRYLFDADGVGMTDLVKRATPRADELTPGEYRAGLDRIARLAAWLRPRVVAFVGLAGWRAAGHPQASAGLQRDMLGGSAVYLMPSTSGRNAHATAADLVRHIEAIAALAGVDRYDAPHVSA